MKNDIGNKILNILDVIADILILFTILTMVASFVIGPYIVFNSSFGNGISGKVSEFYIFFIGLVLPFKAQMRTLFIFEWVIYLSIFTLLAVSGKKTLQIIFKNKFSSIEPLSNNLTASISIFSITIIIVLVIDWFQYNIGIETGNLPPMNPAELLCIISHAPLSEEIGFRLSIIGLFSLFLLKVWRKGISFIEYLVAPIPTLEKKIKDIEEKRRIVRTIFLPLIFTSGIVFGLAHIMPSSVWDVGKATEATFAGIMLGVAYVYYNIGVAILIHWAFNYYSNAIYIFEKNIYNIGLSTSVDTIIILLGIILITKILIKYLIFKEGE
ncbi:MAG: CPBP family glutamic-type intramembrane protease [bacterium]|nr:CPBP family glutamic-type intramembrane protease [bacterium]